MHKSLLQNVIEPLLTRIGTAAAAALVGYGMSVTNEVTVAQAITIIGGVGFDLALRKWFKR